MEAIEAYSRVPVQTVDVGSARLAYRAFGAPAAPPLLLVHGWPFHGGIWAAMLPALAERFRCIAVDLAGAGESDWDEGNDFSFHGHAENLKRFVSALGLEPYRLMAHDTGATVARRLAIIDPERVAQLVIIDTEIPHHRPPLVPFFQRVLLLPGSNAVFRQLLKSRSYLRSRGGLGGCFVDRSLIDGLIAPFVTPLVTSPRRLRGQILYLRGIDWKQLDGLREGHRDIRAPVLLIWGERDPFFPVARAREMIEQLAHCAGFVVIPETKLLPFVERPQLVLDAVLPFFAVS